LAGESDFLSTLRQTLVAQLARFDEDAFIALANRGLLRRAQKDLEKQPANVVEESANELTMSWGEHRIWFDARGPAHASCSCPATGVCQHILAAAISLQRTTGDGPTTPTDSNADIPETLPTPLAAANLVNVTGENADSMSALQSALLSFSNAELVKHAGKAGYRWAWQFVEDLDPQLALRVSGERNILLSFTRPKMAFRYVGGALDNLIADVDMAQVEKYRVAAVLAYQRVHGIEPLPPESAKKAQTAALDLGKDHAASELSSDLQQVSRERFRKSATQLFCESVELGLAHLSRGMYERYSTLAVWAQGVEYYRMAMLLRRIADHIELLLERAGGADEHRLLDELTLAFGLVSALEQAAARDATPIHLAGRARTRYEEASTLTLIGLGASAWRSPSGYVGLTMIFWSPDDKAFLSCADARPESQRGFNPVARYKASGPWSGLGAPAQATGRRVSLAGAKISAAGRLSAAESTSATVLPLVAEKSLAELLQPTTSWVALSEARSAVRRSLLIEPNPMQDWVVLQPARFGERQFDRARQTLVWPLFDADENRISVELLYDEYAAHAITRIEQLRTDHLRAGTMVVARIRSTPNGLIASPLSLIHAKPEIGENPVDALYFDSATEQGLVSKWLGKVRNIGGGDSAAKATPVVASNLSSTLREYRHWLQGQAERGCAREQALKIHAEISSWAKRAADTGFTMFQNVASKNSIATVALLQAHYLCLQYERLIDGQTDDGD
jgi:hypothetical protein